MTPLESKLRALVAEWRGATKAISADGASRPLEWEGKDILRLCADRIEALLAERQEPPVSLSAEQVRKVWDSCNTEYLKSGAKDLWQYLAGRLNALLAAAAPSSGTGETCG